MLADLLACWTVQRLQNEQYSPYQHRQARHKFGFIHEEAYGWICVRMTYESRVCHPDEWEI